MTIRGLLIGVFRPGAVASLWLQTAAPPWPAARLDQFRFESKLWPNLHHFLYVPARSRHGASDGMRLAVRGAPGVGRHNSSTKVRT